MEEFKILTHKGTFTIRPYHAGDEEKIFPAWKLAFSSEINTDWWRWKYLKNPSGFRTMLCLSDTGDVAVNYAAQVYNLWFDGMEIKALHLTDNFSHPNYRWAIGGKSGLFVRTGKVFLKTYLENIPVEPSSALSTPLEIARFHYGFPGVRHYRLGTKLMHYRVFGPGTAFLKKEISIDSVINNKGNDCDEPAFYTELSAITSRLISMMDKGYIDANLKKVDALWDRVSLRTFRCAVKRDYAFYKWRFLTRPDKSYIFLFQHALITRRLKGLIVLDCEVQKGDGLIFKIVDILADGEGSCRAIIKKAVSYIEKEAREGAYLAVWLSNNHPFKEAFQQEGFVEDKEPIGFVPCTRFDMHGIRPERADELIWTMADGDLL